MRGKGSNKRRRLRRIADGTNTVANKPRPMGKKAAKPTHPWKRSYPSKDPITGKPLKVMEVSEIDGDWQD